ncbi:MAG TPA: ABC transporter substrate-binding protein [Usitatibacter sp.]|nr:ABC transporter substrate-binding protein [Usitatibacter sp.]
MRAPAATFILLLSACAALAPEAPPKRVGVLLLGTAESAAPFLASLRQGLREQGYVEGRNLVLEPRYAEGKIDRLGPLAEELVRQPVDAIVGAGNPVIMAAKRATSSIPIVVPATAAPVEVGLVASGANVGAFDVAPATLVRQHVALLREIVPGLRKLAVAWNGSNPAAAALAGRVKSAAGAAGVEVLAIAVSTPAALETPLRQARSQGAQAILVVADPQFFQQRRKIAEWTNASGLPALCQEIEYGEAGCLVANGVNARAMFGQAASYVGEVLRGKPIADLPVGVPARFELVVNAGSAKAGGHVIPDSVRARADRVIP